MSEELREEFRKNAPLVEEDALVEVVLSEILTAEAKRKSECILLGGSFVEPDKDIDRDGSLSDLDIGIVIPEWELPVANSQIPISASGVVVPRPDIREGLNWEGGVETPESRWDCSSDKAWEQLPEYAKETLKNSTKQVLVASEADKASSDLRAYDVFILNPDQYEYLNDEREFLCIWENTGRSDSP